MTERDDRELTRRYFFHTALYSVALAAATQGCFMTQRDPGEPVHLKQRMDAPKEGPEPLPKTGIYPAMPRAVVALRGVNGDIEAAVFEAVQAAGGLAEIEKGQRVMIKPNLCGPGINGKYPRGPITTNPEVLRAVIRLVKKRGAHAIGGDRAMIATELAFQVSGCAKVCKEEGAEPFPWTRAEYIRVFKGQRHWSQGFRIPKILTEVDHLINLPILKSHDGEATQMTCCMKAYVGVLLPLDRWQEGSNAMHAPNFAEKISEVHLAVKPTNNIVDATTILLSGGPDGLKKNALWDKANLIMASKDRVACDSVAFAVMRRYGGEKNIDLPYMKKSIFDNPLLYYPAQLGIGQADPSMITVEDVKVPLIKEIKSTWA
jgi:uncharacterized protein (DUF362 family)